MYARTKNVQVVEPTSNDKGGQVVKKLNIITHNLTRAKVPDDQVNNNSRIQTLQLNMNDKACAVSKKVSIILLLKIT